jgi:hypothetical protein
MMTLHDLPAVLKIAYATIVDDVLASYSATPLNSDQACDV